MLEAPEEWNVEIEPQAKQDRLVHETNGRERVVPDY